MTRIARVFIYVQHLLGIGHLRRSLALARALSNAGFEVTLASGGTPVPALDAGGVTLVQLPAVRAADDRFRCLLDAQGLPINDAWRERRKEALLSAWRSARAEVLIVELFPFGRRQMRFELLPLLEEARARPANALIACSLRDVIQQKPDTARTEQILQWVERYFDFVLVHGDPDFLPLDVSFSAAARLRGKLRYTGYLTDDPAKPCSAPAGEGAVLISAGGGAVGRRLLETAIRARALSSLSNRNWRILTGANLPMPEVEELRALAEKTDPGAIIVERHREDFRSLLANCALSVSQGGYNTVIEALQAGARTLVVPFAGGAESEQTLRATLLAQRGLIDVLAEEDLDPLTLALAIDRAAQRPRPKQGALDLDGGRRSAELIRGWVSGASRAAQ